jgi:chloramphenicol 3-O-phosphotransferase
MVTLDEPHAILIIGPFGSGKSSLAGEIADVVEGDLPYAAIDLDWLAWFDTGDAVADDAEGHAVSAVELRNLSDVVRNYLEVGIRLFVIAAAIRFAWEVEALRGVLPMRITIVRLDVPLDEIERRIGSDDTEGRQNDLRRTREWIEAGEGIGFEDVVIANTAPLREVALTVIQRVLSASV